MKKQIWLFSYTNAVGGAEKCIQQLLQANANSPSYDVQVAVLRPSPQESALFSTSASWWSFLFKKKDVLHSHLFWSGLFVRLYKTFDRKSNWIHTVHYADYQGQSFARLKKFLDENFIFPKVNRLVFVSPVAQQNFPFYLNSQVILNSLDLKDQKSSVTKLKELTEPVLGCVAQLRKEKGLFDLIDTLKEVQKTYPKARLKIAGSGPLEKALLNYAKEKNVSQSLQLCGYVKNLDKFYQDVDVYIQPSFSESFGLASLEALSFNKPVICAKVGFLKTLFAEERGVLIERDVNFVQNTAKAISSVLVNYKVHQSRSLDAFNYWQQRLAGQGMAKAYFQLYEEILKPAICMLAPIVTLTKGGLQQQLYLQSHEIKKSGFRVFVLQNQDSRLISKDDKDKEFKQQWSHIDFWQVPQFFPWVRVRGLWFLLCGIFILIVHRKEISLFHAHQLYSPTILGAFGKWLTKAPLVTKVTASGELGEAANLRQLPFFNLRKKIFKSIDRVFTLTEDMRQEMSQLEIPKAHVQIISNSVELPKLIEEELMVNNTGKLLYVGRLSTEKSIETILFAFDKLKKDNPSLQLKIVGGAYPQRDASEYLKTIVQSMSSSQGLSFLGQQSDVASYYRERPVFILSSKSEGMSNALLEALSYGLICIVSDIPANLFLINDQVNGFVFKQGDPESLSQVILHCQKMTAQQLAQVAQSARRTIEEKYSTKVIGKKITDVYDELIKADLTL